MAPVSKEKPLKIQNSLIQFNQQSKDGGFNDQINSTSRTDNPKP